MHFFHSFVCSLAQQMLTTGCVVRAGDLKMVKTACIFKELILCGEDRHIYRKAGTQELGDPEFRMAVLSGGVTI